MIKGNFYNYPGFLNYAWYVTGFFFVSCKNPGELRVDLRIFRK
jgi:hypothetical protein